VHALSQVASALQAGNLDEAERTCRLILQSDPRQVDALNLLGVTLLRRGDAKGALEALTRACELDRKFADAAYNRAIALGELERWDEALAIYDRVLRTDASNVRAWNNRGNVLQKLGRWKEALAAYDRTLALQPNQANAHHNLALALLALARPRVALAALVRAVALAPDNAEAQWTKSLAHLVLGEFEPGWRLHEWRWKTAQMAHLARDFREPLWLGQAGIEGKTILLHADQGLGDAIQMARYVRLVEARGARVIVEVPPPLVSLMGSVSPTIQVVARDAALPRFEMHCPLGSLPLAFRTTLESIPANAPYLHADQAAVGRWATRLGARERPRIGIAWSGRPTHRRDRDRSIAFETLKPLLDARFEWHALQTVFREGDDEAARAAGVKVWRDELRDFTETAALVMNLDRVVSVDTSVAHLAGALAKPVSILVPFEPDYRWLLDRDDSPWYPSARLIRQPALGDWNSALASVRAALDAAT
jgi:Flp pilus assembly protein TadD